MATNQNNLEITDMMRATYRTQLITALQQVVSQYTPFVTWLPNCSGKQMEFNTRGTTEWEFRNNRYEDVNPDELDWGKRSLIPVGLHKEMQWSEDDMILRGGFPVANQDFIEEMSNGLARISDAVIVGSHYSASNKRWEVAPAIPTLDTKTSFYKGAGIGGILGPAYIGEYLNTPEEIPTTPALTTGSSYDGTNLDKKVTSVIPVDYTSTGTPTVSSMTIPKLLGALECLATREGMSDNEEVIVGITPGMQYELMQLDEFKNVDFGRKSLVDGFSKTFLNVRFLVTNMIPQTEVSVGGETKTVYTCPVWKKNDIYAGWWENVKYKICMPDQKIDQILIKAKCALGCARRRFETVLAIHCAV